MINNLQKDLDQLEINSKLVFDFLYIKTLFAFRLSSKSGNKLILLLLQKKVNNLQNKKEKLQQQLAQQQLESQAVHDSQETNQFLEQFRKDQTDIQSLHSYDICELRALCNPPQGVVKTLELLTILLNYRKSVSWNNSKYFKRYIKYQPYLKYYPYIIITKIKRILKVAAALQYQNIQSILNLLSRLEEALENYDMAFKFKENNPDYLTNNGNLLL